MAAAAPAAIAIGKGLLIGAGTAGAAAVVSKQVAPNRKDTAAIMSPATSPVQPIEPPKELAAPTIEDAQPAAKEERKRNSRQRGRASTIFAGALGDDSKQASTAKATLGA